MDRLPPDQPTPRRSLGEQFSDALNDEGFFVDPSARPSAEPFVVSVPLVQCLGLATPIWSVAVAPDDSRLIWGSGWHGQAGAIDCNVRMCNLATLSETACMRGHTGHVNAVAFSPDGRFAVSASDDRTVRHWDLRTGMQTARFGHPNSVKAVAYARHGQWLVSAGVDKAIRFSNPSGQPLPCYEGHTETVQSLALSPDARLLASSSEDKTIRLWDLSKGAEFYRLELPRPAGRLAFSRDGSLLAYASLDETILFDVRKLQSIQRLTTVGTPTFSPIDDSILLNTGQQLQLWRVGGGFPEVVYLTGPVVSVAFFNKTKHFVTGDYDKTLRIWGVPS